MTSAAALTRRLGGTWHSGKPSYGLVKCVAHDDSTPSLSIRDGNHGVLVHCFAGCDAWDVLAELQRRRLIEDGDRGGRRRRPTRLARSTKSDRAALARWLWSQRKPIAGSIAERYLREARGYRGPFPATLGFLPPRKPEHHPAMTAAFGIPDEPQPGVLGELLNVTAIHLTLLKPDGAGKAEVKPNKICIGSPRGRPIVLAPPNDLLGLAICEGVEDALSVYEATGLGAWAAGAAGFMSGLADAVSEHIEAVTIYAHDDNGKRFALELADALENRGMEVRIEGLAW